jgi:hypothetical protein
MFLVTITTMHQKFVGNVNSATAFWWPRRGPYPHTDPGVEVPRIFHLLRHQAIEPLNGLFKNVFEWGGQVPVKGLKRTQLIVLGAVLLYQLALLYQFEHGKPLAQGIKPLLRAT